MSELKAIQGVINGQQFELYFKSDADHYISELIADQQLELDDWYCKVQHHKYKRCLDMVAYCDLKMSYWAIREIHEGDTGKFDLYSKWHERWQELAEKFKPNSTHQQKD